MSVCNPRIRLLSVVPENILAILQHELDNWEFENPKYRTHDPVFINHSIFKWDPLNLESMAPVVEWCQSFVSVPSTAVQLMFNAIPPMTSCPAHVDTLKFHLFSDRMHIPVLNHQHGNHYTFDRVSDRWEVTQWQMEAGKLWGLDNIRSHAVGNHGNEWRINFIIDIMPTVIYKTRVWKDWLKPDPAQNKMLETINAEFKYQPHLAEWSYHNLINQ